MDQRSDRIDVPGGLYWQSRFFAATRGFWRLMARLESGAVADDLGGIEIKKPVYVTSLARAGTTIVTELLEQHPALTCHHYSDFPNVWTPYWRNYLLQRSRSAVPERSERSHRDRILVSQDSPEAVEEVLWMGFFDGLHDPGQSNVLNKATENPEFEKFYADHIRKLLAVRRAARYLAKGNYNISRLGYLRKLFPDARFLIPVREPTHHIASLAKQHRLFSRGHELDGRVGRQLSMSGHFEFGPYRCPVNFGNMEETERIQAAWNDGRETEGWARYWAATYMFLADQLATDTDLARRCALFRYEELCTRSEAVIDALLQHCDLDPRPFEETRSKYSKLLTLPDYYQPAFTEEEAALIEAHCGDAYRRVLQLCLST